MNMEFMKDWRPSSVKLVVVEDGGTNIEHQENHYGNGRDDEKRHGGNVAPNALNTEHAKALLAICRENGWVDERDMPLISQPKAAILASVLSDALGLSPRWQPFEELWGIPELANKLSKAQMCKYYSESLGKYEKALI